VRLGELARLGEEGGAEEARRGPAGGALGRRLFVSGCKSLPEAVEQLLDAVTPDDLLELDVRVEEVLRERFTALVHVCLSSANVLREVDEALRACAEEFLTEKLPPTSAAELFLEQHADEDEAEGELLAFFDEAAPELGPPLRSARAPAGEELVVVASPPGPGGDRLREVLTRGLSHKEVQQAASDDDVVLYRERANLALTDLEQLGPLGRDAYLQLTSTDHFTPHTRTDVDFKPR
jgi:hypothetical protein